MTSVAQIATLVHGYTLARVDRLAHQAANKATAARALDPVEAREEAWHGIVELLYLCPEKPAEWSLVEAGARAIGHRVQVDVRDRGLRRRRDGTVDEQYGLYEEAPRFNAFWVHIVGAKPDWTDAIVERMALPRALSVLTPNQYEAIAALAAHGDMESAANALDIGYWAIQDRVRRARERMMEVWFEHETPRSTTRVDPKLMCQNGHPRAEYGWHNGSQWRCRKCLAINMRRHRARSDELEEVPEPVEPAPLTFAPAPEDADQPVGARKPLTFGKAVIGSTACWCGLHAGHDWPHKGEGAPHPATEVA